MAIFPHPPTQLKHLPTPERISEAGRRVSETTYWNDYYNHPTINYEWNNGILEEVPVSNLVQYTLYSWFVALLEQYLRIHPIAHTIGLETGFKLILGGGKKSIRKPDLGIVLHENPQPLGPTDGSYKGRFDLCIESVSTSTIREIERDTIQKKGEYARAGVPEYYILDPSNEHTAFYQLTRRGIYKPIPLSDDGVIRSKILPGFQFRLTDLTLQPSVIEMANDKVYQGFMLPEHQQAQRYAASEHQRAERERERAEQEHQRAEQERERAERALQEIERLRALLEKSNQ